MLNEKMPPATRNDMEVYGNTMLTLSDITIPTLVGSIRDAASRQRAATLLKEGYPVGSFVRAVCAIWVDASNMDAVSAIEKVKGPRRIGRPISTVLSASEFVRLIDPDRVPVDL